MAWIPCPAVSRLLCFLMGRTGTAEWIRTTKRIKARDGHRCTWIEDGQRCTGTADEVDHILEFADGGTDDDSNLRSLCIDHHRRKTAAHANRTRWSKAARRRPSPPHPGLRGGG